MKKLLVVYNITGIQVQYGGTESFPWYVNSLQSLLAQTVREKWGEDYQVVVSGCMSTDGVQNGLRQAFGDTLSYNWVEESFPLSITFNDTIDQCVKYFGEFEGYLYLDSGISFWDPSKHYDAMEKFWEVFNSGTYGITAAMPSNDDGSSWWGIQYEKDVDHIFPIGSTTNMHCQIFSEEFRKNYSKILPDIFANNTMESTYSHLCAAINSKFIITQKIHLLHNHSMDGASIGWRDKGLLFRTEKSMDQRYREGYKYGFGYEEFKPQWLHDPEKYDENGFAKDPMLKEFLAKELYLKKEEFDYSTIRRNFIPRAL